MNTPRIGSSIMVRGCCYYCSKSRMFSLYISQNETTICDFIWDYFWIQSNMQSRVMETRPSSSLRPRLVPEPRLPNMVQVLPEPVMPQMKTVELNPCRTLAMGVTMVCWNTRQLLTPSSNTSSYVYTFSTSLTEQQGEVIQTLWLFTIFSTWLLGSWVMGGFMRRYILKFQSEMVGICLSSSWGVLGFFIIFFINVKISNFISSSTCIPAQDNPRINITQETQDSFVKNWLWIADDDIAGGLKPTALQIVHNNNIYIFSVGMGNKLGGNDNDDFIRAVSEMKKNKNEYPVEKISTHLQERYRDHLMSTLAKQEMSKSVRRLLEECIEKKVKKQDLTSTISVLNSLRSNNVEQLLRASVSLTKEAGESKNVVVKFDERKPKNVKKMADRKSSTSNNYMSYREEDTLEGRVKFTGQFISKELNKPYHPFKFLCKRFADILLTYEQTQKPSKTETEYELKQQLQRKAIKQFCQFMVVGCVGVYRKWIMEYTGLEDKKYGKWMSSLVMNEIWGVNDAYMLNTMLRVIRKTRIGLKIDLEGLSTCSSIGVIKPKDFGIDEQLQIEGNYLISIFQMSALTEKKKPTLMLKQLQNIKNSICMDIDNYHRLYEKGQIYEINGDNIMGIVAFILSRISEKIEQISLILLFLKVVYGEGIYYSMDTSSYMYSTIWGAIEYLESRTFHLPKHEQVDKELKNTSCVESSFVSGTQANGDQVNN